MKKHSDTLTGQEAYVRDHYRHHRLVAAARLLLFGALLLLWEVSADLGLIDSFFFSSPVRVGKCFYSQLLYNDLCLHIGITLLETILSFLLVMLLGLLPAIALLFSKTLSEIAEPYLVILNSLPKSALAPLFIVWLGTGMKTIIVAGISVAIFGTIISFYTAFRQVDSDKLMLIATLGGTRRDAFLRVIFPASLPILISTAKVNIGLSLVGVIIGEFLAARRGLGHLIIYGTQVFQLDMVITAIIILCVIAFCFYQLIQRIEHNCKKKYTL